MNPIPTLDPRPGVRLASVALASLTSLSLLASLATTMHPARIGQQVQVVELERVTVYAERAAQPTAVVAVQPRTASN